MEAKHSSQPDVDFSNSQIIEILAQSTNSLNNSGDQGDQLVRLFGDFCNQKINFIKKELAKNFILEFNKNDEIYKNITSNLKVLKNELSEEDEKAGYIARKLSYNEKGEIWCDRLPGFVRSLRKVCRGLSDSFAQKAFSKDTGFSDKMDIQNLSKFKDLVKTYFNSVSIKNAEDFKTINSLFIEAIEGLKRLKRVYDTEYDATKADNKNENAQTVQKTINSFNKIVKRLNEKQEYVTDTNLSTRLDNQATYIMKRTQDEAAQINYLMNYLKNEDKTSIEELLKIHDNLGQILSTIKGFKKEEKLLLIAEYMIKIKSYRDSEILPVLDAISGDLAIIASPKDVPDNDQKEGFRSILRNHSEKEPYLFRTTFQIIASKLAEKLAEIAQQKIQNQQDAEEYKQKTTRIFEGLKALGCGVGGAAAAAGAIALPNAVTSPLLASIALTFFTKGGTHAVSAFKKISTEEKETLRHDLKSLGKLMVDKPEDAISVFEKEYKKGQDATKTYQQTIDQIAKLTALLGNNE